MKLKITTIGNSAGVILPKELLARLRLEKGDTLYALETPDGVRLTAFDPELAAQMEVAEEVKPHLHLMNRELIGFLPHLVAPEEMVQILFSDGWANSLDPAPASFVVDLTGGREDELEIFSPVLQGKNALFLVDEERCMKTDEGRSLALASASEFAPKIANWIKTI